MVVGATADEGVAEPALALGLAEALGEGFCVGEDLGLVGVEVGTLCLLEGDGEGGDGVVVSTPLVAGANSVVDGAFEVL